MVSFQYVCWLYRADQQSSHSFCCNDLTTPVGGNKALNLPKSARTKKKPFDDCTVSSIDLNICVSLTTRLVTVSKVYMMQVNNRITLWLPKSLMLD